jgi:hypothetical protein
MLSSAPSKFARKSSRLAVSFFFLLRLPHTCQKPRGGKPVKILRKIIIILSLIMLTACSGMSRIAQPSMAPLVLEQSAASSNKQLDDNHFRTDRTTNLSEEELKRILSAPVFLEERARLGVIPVATCYAPDNDLPLAVVPQALSTSLEKTGLFQVSTEVSTDWPAQSGVAGLRELAARYRSEYLLLYRHRFVERSFTNDWAWLYATFVGIFFVPSQTLETAGVLEATLFEVKSGTLLFTVYERVEDRQTANIWRNKRKIRMLKENLLSEASEKLANRVVNKVQLLASARADYQIDEE